MLAVFLLLPWAVQGADKVRVELFAEAGCPFCRAAIAGPVNKTLSTPSVAAIMDFEFFPWGNAYFVTEECKGAGEYDMSARHCYNKRCGAGAASPPKDCFSGDLVCQHGAQECEADRYLACAKGLGPGFMAFAHCLEGGYDSYSQELVSSCAASTGLDLEKLKKCSGSSAGDDAVVAQAKATPDHPGVPYMMVNGKPLEQPNDLLKTVCKAYTGTAPEACKESEPKAKVSFVYV
ncbi:unnamed protein product [Effrenium voratum]|nr:unnamed protein product [Effrenium voratum]